MDKALRDRLIQAATVTCIRAKKIASVFSRRIPAATYVESSSDDVAIVTSATDAPNAPPFEFAKRHPLFGDKEHWYTQPFRPYMAQARDETMEQISQIVAGTYDDWMREEGYH